MIYLWNDQMGWEAFELSDAVELEKRNICICAGATIGAGAKPVVIRILGLRYPLTYWGEDRIDIGCQSKSIHDWLTDYEALAQKYAVTADEIATYRLYVEFIARIHKGEPAP